MVIDKWVNMLIIDEVMYFSVQLLYDCCYCFVLGVVCVLVVYCVLVVLGGLVNFNVFLFVSVLGCVEFIIMCFGGQDS